MDSVRITKVSLLQTNLLNTDTPKGQIVQITEVSALNTNLVNTDIKDTECPNYRGVCITVKRGPVGTVLRSLRTKRWISNIQVSIKRESTALATISLP